MSKYMTATELSSEIRENLKKEFPDLTFSVTKESYTGGRSITVAWMKGFDPFTSEELREEGYLQINHYYIDDDKRINDAAKKVLKRAFEIANEKNWDKSDPMSDYFNVNYYLHLHIGKWDKKYQVTTTSQPKSFGSFRSGRRPQGSTTKFDFGTELKKCGGWIIYKKTLDDGRVVYSCVKMEDTPKTNDDWNLVKGEIYTETGWKWSKWGKFERWGNISDESENIEKLCSILRKYYVSDAPSTSTGEIDQEKLQAAIRALSVLANAGNEFAQKQINVLKLLIK